MTVRTEQGACRRVRSATLPITHRLIPGAKMRLRGESPQQVLEAIVERIPVPVEENWEGSHVS